MTVDIRASVTCSLGTLISASISDDYIQGTGLIKCKGSCELSGIYTPTVGTVVTFSYTKDSVTRTVPRKLRVLSSFADPFRRTTRVELGCKLTYLQDVKERINWDALDDPENTGITEADSKIVTIPIHAQSIAAECCSKLGITTSGLALTNKFSIEEFDFSAGFVSILSDLLVSECYCGYMDESEVLQIFSLSVTGGTGPVLDSSKLIDLGQIGVGDLPGDAVVVNYNSLKLKVPDDEEVVCRLATDDSNESTWGADSSFTSTPSSATFAYKVDGEDPLLFRTFKWLDTSAETNYYAEFDVLDPDDPNAPPQKRKLLTSRVIRIGSSAAAIGGGYITERLTNGYGFGNYGVSKRSREEFQYDQYGNETYRELTTKGNLLYLYGGAGINFVYVDENENKSIVEIDTETQVPLEKIVVQTNRYGNIVKTVTKRFGPWAETIAGQQSIATARDAIDTASSAAAYLGAAYGDLYLLDVTTEINISGSTAGQEIPSEGEVLTGSLAEDSGDPDNGFTTYSSSELELALGSATATRRIELSMPYAPDDTFYRVTVSTSPLRYCFYSRKSDAPAKAAAYGRAQNRLLLGNRNGMNIQTSPELLPAAPFSPVIVQANGLSALYRANASSWTMDSNGIVISSDMLFWGAVGGTGTFWFPVAPGVTALPTTPPVVGGEMTVSQVVLPYNEIVKVTAQLRTKLEVTSFDYPLTTLTAVDPYGVAVGLVVRSITAYIAPPATSITTGANAPHVGISATVFAPTAAIQLTGAAPAVTIVITTYVFAPSSNISVTVYAPGISTPTGIIAVPQNTISMTGGLPRVLDAATVAYVQAVETADAQALETAVIIAYDDFIRGCKSDGIWNAIKASCIMAGARTLAGALTPLVGTAPTNNNFVAGDYNRKTGLVGDGSTKYLDSNRNNNADPQDSKHLTVYINSATTVNGCYISTTNVNVSGDSYIYMNGSTLTHYSKINQAVTAAAGILGPGLGLYGASRGSSASYSERINGVNTIRNSASSSPLSENLLVYGTPAIRANSRLSFYSIGESLDLALLDSRVTTLMADIAAAIP